MRVLKNYVYFVYISPAFSNAGAIIDCGCYMKFLHHNECIENQKYSRKDCFIILLVHSVHIQISVKGFVINLV